jgi:DNA-binding SARP family transcriptional activator
MELDLLGPLRVRDADGGPVSIPRGSARVMLAYLALQHPAPAPADELVEALWGPSPPATARTKVHGLVAKLRSILGADAITTSASGYVLEVTTRDLEDFRALVQEAAEARRNGDPVRALAALKRAIALRRGPVLDGTPVYGPAALDGDRIEIEFREAQRWLFELELGSGGHVGLLPQLEQAAIEAPYDEGIRALLAVGLYRAGRQADALASLRDLRSVLRDDLGLRPGPEVVAVESAILRGDLQGPGPLGSSVRARRSTTRILTILRAVVELDARDATTAAMLGHLSSCVRDHGGEALVLPGEGLLGLWGWPAGGDEQPARAAAAGFAMLGARSDHGRHDTLRLGLTPGATGARTRAATSVW